MLTRPIKLLAACCTIGLLGGMFASPAMGGSNGETLLPDNGPCDKSLPKVHLGLITVVESPVLSLGDQADAAEASVKAFNKRGGVGDHCMEITICDDGADANQATVCAREFADSDIVATVNDTTAFGTEDVVEILEAAGIPRIGVSPSFPELNSPITYAIGGGGAGNTFMMVPPLARSGVEKIYMIGFDSPQIDALPATMQTMFDAYGVEFLGVSKVPAGTTDFQQFILAAEDAGAEGVILPLGENEALQVLQAAQQLGTDLEFSASLGTFGQADVEAMGDFAEQIHFNSEVPPVTGSTKKWPILPTVIKDLSASGKKELTKNQLKSSPLRSWIAVYHFVTIMDQSGDIDVIAGSDTAAARAAVTAALNSATEVDTFGLIPPWTPNQEGGFLGVKRISQPFYYTVTWNGKKFVVADELLNSTEEMNGNIDYEQPAS
jgi:ABC-type branched-subunit amino acid transport system substrate-binding protein